MTQTIADKVAELFDNDGQRFNLDDGRTLHEAMVDDFGAVVDRSGGFVDSPVAQSLSMGTVGTSKAMSRSVGLETEQ